MNPLPIVTSNPIFVAYAITCIILSANLLALWVSSGAVRARGGVAINSEDGARYGFRFRMKIRPWSRGFCVLTVTRRPRSTHFSLSDCYM